MVFEEFVKAQPLLSIMLFSAVITFFLTLIYKFLINQDKSKEIKARMKEMQEKSKNEKDVKKMAELQKEMLELSMQQMRMSFKPMLITFLPLILVFGGLRALYSSTGDIISWGAKIPIFGTGAGWLLSYIIFSLIFGIIFRKILGVQ